MVPMTVLMQCFALCVSNRGLSLHLIVVATPTLAVGKGKVAKGKVTKPAKKGHACQGQCEQYEDQCNACHRACHEEGQDEQTVGMIVPNGEEEKS